MKLFAPNKKISLVLAPVDMRSGYLSLAVRAEVDLGIRVDEGRDTVVFLSKKGRICKIIDADRFGCTVLTRRLKGRAFQQLLAKIEGRPVEPLTVKELERFLDGKPIRIKRSSMVYG